MGYTHRWSHYGFTDEQWNQVKSYTQKIITASNIPLWFESDMNEPPSITNDSIRFNGVEDDGCETFLIKKATHSDFCKTRQKPYDVVVVAMLFMLNYVNPTFKWSSDGDDDELSEGKELFQKVTGNLK